MVKWIAIAVLMLGSVTLISMIMKRSKYRFSIKKLALHWIVAALLLFMLHSIELTSGIAVPMTPLSMTTIAVLGIPGLALVQGIYILL